MRHLKSGRKLGRKTEQRKALARGIALGLIGQFGVENREYIVTTKAKAKEFRGFVERIITLGKKALAADASPERKLALRRQAASMLPNRPAVKKVFEAIAPRYKDRPGGYVRVLKTGSHRLGDGAQKVLFAFTPATSATAAAAAPRPVKRG
jgi:large subunit ribosomal protein L17